MNGSPLSSVYWSSSALRQREVATRLGCMLLAMGYGLTLSSLPVDAFADRGNYLIYARDSWAILQRYLAMGPIVLLANEPLWLVINGLLSSVLSDEAVVRTIIFTSATLVAWVTLRHDVRGFAWLLLILILPQVVKNHIVHLRQGLAVAVFLLAWTSVRPWRRWVLFLSTPFIHASFLFVLAILLLATWTDWLRLAVDVRSAAFLLAGIAAAAGLGWLASLFGARQGDVYLFAAGGGTGAGFAVWACILLLFLLEGRAFGRQRAFETGIVILYLATYFFVEVTARILESAMIPVLLAGLMLTDWRRLAFITIVLGTAVVDYALRLGQPWLGFAAG